MSTPCYHATLQHINATHGYQTSSTYEHGAQRVRRGGRVLVPLAKPLLRVLFQRWQMLLDASLFVNLFDFLRTANLSYAAPTCEHDETSNLSDRGMSCRYRSGNRRKND